MLPQIWTKSLPSIVLMEPADVAENFLPLPLLLALSWNHYIGLYYEVIIKFFSAYFPYPARQGQFWLQLDSVRLNGTQIIGLLVVTHQKDLTKPIQFTCHFRSTQPVPQMNLKRHFKNSLKASTSLRYGRSGSSVITVDMSVSDVDRMYDNFSKGDYLGYLGESGEEGKKLGYNFITGQIDRIKAIPVKIIGKNILIERAIPKATTIREFLEQIIEGGTQEISKFETEDAQQREKDRPFRGSIDFEHQQEDPVWKLNIEKLPLKLHGVQVKYSEVSFDFLQRYCHPDGYLYFTL